MPSYRVFRILTVVCALAVIVITICFYLSITDEKNLLLLSGILAVLAPIFGIFAVKPIESEITGGFDKLLVTYDKDTLERLQQAKKEEEQLRQFIEYKSNEIFLVKLRSYLEASIISKYQGSEIEKLIVDLEVVETQLNTLNVPYGKLQLPERFKRIVEEVSRRNRAEEQLSFYKSVVRSLPFPSTVTKVIESILPLYIRR